MLAIGGCYGPRVPTGAACDPLAPACPDGQACVTTAGGSFCGEPGQGPDAAPDVPPVDAGALAHVKLAPGWSADVFRDFSADHAFVPVEFVDGAESYSNLPDRLFVLDAPFARTLGMLAGRQVIELSREGYVVHDFGRHAPNTAGLPDYLRGATFVASLDGGGPAVLVSSSSSLGGDGSFKIDPAWSIATDDVKNNVRAVLYDQAGAFDARPAAEGYLGTQNGVVRRSDDMLIVPGDNQSMRVIGEDLLVARFVMGAGMQLIRVAGKTHEEKQLASARDLQIGDGAPPPPALAWAVVDQQAVKLVGEGGELDTIAETNDPDFVWQAVAAPAKPHPLAGATPTLYVLEGNRARDVDRVLVLTGP